MKNPNPLRRFWHVCLEKDPTGARLTHAFKVALIFAVTGALFFIWHRPQFQWAVIAATLLPDTSLGFTTANAKKWNVLLTGIAIAALVFALTMLGQTAAMCLLFTFIAILVVFALMSFGNQFMAHGPYLAIYIILALAYPSHYDDALNRLIAILIGTGISFLLYFYFPIFDVNLLMSRSIVRKAIRDLSYYTKRLTRHHDTQLNQHRINSWRSLSAFEQTLADIHVPAWRVARGQLVVKEIWNLRRDLTLWQQLVRSYPQLAIVSTLMLNNLRYNLNHCHLPCKPFKDRRLTGDTRSLPLDAQHCLQSIQTHFTELKEALELKKAPT